ncbi:MAG TPA: biopolymer transporter ExbD [Thermoanaerobaculia bacterium]|jgi:biopolymer transport protein TolR
MQTTSRALQSDINVTPLVDVCLVLLIIFMVVVPAMVNGVDVQLPETKHSGPIDPEKRPFEITIKDDGTVYLEELIVRQDEVAGELQRVHERAALRPVAVRADKRVKYGEVIAVLDACRKAGGRMWGW